MLNEYQRRSLKVTLSIVEKSLRDIEKILNENDHKGVLYTFSNNIPPTAKEKVSLLISKVYRTIRNVAEKFNLGKESKYANREAFAKLPHCWEILEDSKAEKLKRYGAVTPGLEEALDPTLDIIIDYILKIEHLLRGIQK
jgi:hypothetical protein